MSGWYLPGLALAVVVGVGVGAAGAHSPDGGGMPAIYMKRQMEVDQNLRALDNSATAKGLFAASIQWPPSYPRLRVCFFGGSPAVRVGIMKVADTWITENVGIKLDWGRPDKPRACDPNDGKEDQIRVSFDRPNMWSLLGQASIIYAKQSEPSLNLKGFDAMNPSQFESGVPRGLILHEFGHALGLLHEHQSPTATCKDEFNFEYIGKFLASPPLNFTPEMITFNMQPFTDPDLVTTAFDPKSVMLYYFPPEYYKNGTASTCYIPAENNEISPTDHKTLATMYPSDAGERMKLSSVRRDAMQALLTKAEAEGKKAGGLDIMATFFRATGTADMPPDE